MHNIHNLSILPTANEEHYTYSFACSKLLIISRPVIHEVAHSVGKSRVLEKVSA